MRMLSGAALCALAGCAAPTERVSGPEAAGLPVVRPFAASDGVCRVLGENALTGPYLDHTATLVGCPAAAGGVLARLEADGALRVAREEDWVLLSVPRGPGPSP